MVEVSLKYFKLIFFILILLSGIFFIAEGFLNLKKITLFINENHTQIQKTKNKPEKKFNINNLDEKKIIDNSNIKLIKKTIIVKKNDTFSKILKQFVNSSNKSNKIINEINKKMNLKNLKINQEIFFYVNKNVLKKIIFPIDFYNELVIDLNNNDINIFNNQILFTKESTSLEFKINSSLYQNGIQAGLPIAVLTEAIRLYSFDLDFQRDIKKNTIFQVLYETLYNEKRDTFYFGKIEYINLIINNKKLEYFLFKTDDNFYDYFDGEGKNVKKSLLKTPIDGAKLSSNFGMRKHPISGYNKLHKGVDFAAPKGTPVYAGGNGIIDFVGKNGGYGNFIKIRHNNEYKTAYAHLASFKKGISKGKRVNQGDIIGYVGSTGNSTGPHLHYEIIYQNKHINPMKMKLPSGKTLEGQDLIKFKDNSKKIYARYLFNLYE